MTSTPSPTESMLCRREATMRLTSPASFGSERFPPTVSKSSKNRTHLRLRDLVPFRDF